MTFKIGDRVAFRVDADTSIEAHVIDVDADAGLVQIDHGSSGWTHPDWLEPLK